MTHFRMTPTVVLFATAALVGAFIVDSAATAAPYSGGTQSGSRAGAYSQKAPQRHWSSRPTQSPSSSPSVSTTPTPTPTPSVSESGVLTTPLTSQINERTTAVTRDSSSLDAYYCSNAPLSTANAAVTTVVIVIHGDSRTACDQARYVAEAANDRSTLASTLVLAPHFLANTDSQAGNPGALYWSDSGWKSGADSLTAPYSRPFSVSSFEVVDEFIGEVSNANRFPNLSRIVVVGHSAGGQFTNRYAAGTHVPPSSTPNIARRYVIANPSSYLYFDSLRPSPAGFRELTGSEQSGCSWYDTYKYGLSGLNSYMAVRPADQIREQYQASTIAYLLGANDNDPLDSSLDQSCAAEYQGSQRVERGTNYYSYLALEFGDSVYTRHSLTMVPQVAHSAHDMLTSPQGELALFP